MTASTRSPELATARRVRLRLAPGVPELGALGTTDTRAWFGERALEGEQEPALGSTALEAGGTRRRFPLPGTPREPGGPPVGRPRGAGTGWCVVERWRGAPLGALLRARFSAPPSTSLAERRWNLLCHLRAAGVGTPEPLCVGARGAGLVSRDSFLVTREPSRFTALDAWLASQRPSEERALGLESLAATLARLVEAGVALPGAQPAHLAVAPLSRACEDQPEEGRAVLRRLPSVILLETTGGRLRGPIPAREVVVLLRSLLPSRLPLGAPERAELLERVLAHLPGARADAVRASLSGTGV